MVSKNPAIGHGFLKNHRFFLERKSVEFTLDGKPCAMPRYYKRKFFDDYPDIKEEINSALAAKVAELAEGEYEIASALNPGLSTLQLKRRVYENKCLYDSEFKKRKG